MFAGGIKQKVVRISKEKNKSLYRSDLHLNTIEKKSIEV